MTELSWRLLITSPQTATVLSAVPPRYAGVASAVNNDVARAAACRAGFRQPWASPAGTVSGSTTL
jgi:hypothetical protein